MPSRGIEPLSQVPETCTPRLPSSMPSRGIEPLSQVPETCTLSIELRGLRLWRAGGRYPLSYEGSGYGGPEVGIH